MIFAMDITKDILVRLLTKSNRKNDIINVEVKFKVE